ncbi:hypothetical protein [Streptomyces sp. NPDC004728]
MTTGFAAPDPAPPAPSTRVLFTTCMDLVMTRLACSFSRIDYR